MISMLKKNSESLHCGPHVYCQGWVWRSLANNWKAVWRDGELCDEGDWDDKTLPDSAGLRPSKIGKLRLECARMPCFQLNASNSEDHPCAGAGTVLQFAVARQRVQHLQALLQHGYHHNYQKMASIESPKRQIWSNIYVCGLYSFLSVKVIQWSVF